MLPRPSPERLALRPAALALAAACALSACAMFRGGGTPDNEPTLKTLANRKVTVDKDRRRRRQRDEGDRGLSQVPRHRAAGAAALRGDAPPRRPRDGQRRQPAAPSARHGASAPDYKAAIARYQDFLKTYPNDPNNDRVLYQMARAYEQGGDLETALKTLDRLVKDYPATRYRDEAQFRRGELLFTHKDYAERREGVRDRARRRPDANPYHDRSLYMHGWSQFKQGRLEDGAAARSSACSTSRSPAARARPASTRSPA